MTEPADYEDHTYDQNYADYKAMVIRNGFGEPMTREQWQKAADSDDD